MNTWQDMGISVSPSAIGPEFYTQCPKCGPFRKKQNMKCLSANIIENVWCCHHCGWSGSLKTGEWQRSEVKRVYVKPTYKPETPNEQMFKWFDSRGIPSFVVERNHISTEVVWIPQINKETRAIRFPFKRNGEVINIKSRDKDKNFRMESNAERIFYGMDDCTEGIAVIVEGEIDKLSVETAGIRHCVSVPDGAPSEKSKDYSSKFEFLDNCQEWLDTINTFIIAVDTDAPGRKLEAELSRRLGMEKCKRVVWPTDCKDANDVLLKHGMITLKDCITNAQHFPISGVFTVDDVMPDVYDLYEKGHQRGLTVGWTKFDELYSVHPGGLTVITGVPNHGKSEFLDAILCRLAARNGTKYAIFSPENQPLALHNLKISEKYIGKPAFGKNRFSRDELEEARVWIREHFIFILPPPDERSVEKLIETVTRVTKQHGISGVIFDPWNEFEHKRPAHYTEGEYIAWAIMRVKEMAKVCGIHVWIVAHPTKMQRDKDLKAKIGIDAYVVPGAYDISGSANWNNKPEVVMCVYRWFEGPDEGKIDVHIQKVRFKGIGKRGKAQFTYDYMTGRYAEVDSYDDPDNWRNNNANVSDPF